MGSAACRLNPRIFFPQLYARLYAHKGVRCELSPAWAGAAPGAGSKSGNKSAGVAGLGLSCQGWEFGRDAGVDGGKIIIKTHLSSPIKKWARNQSEANMEQKCAFVLRPSFLSSLILEKQSDWNVWWIPGTTASGRWVPIL